MRDKKFKNTDVAFIFDRYPAAIRKKLKFIRQLIFAVAKSIPEVGELEETIKWGQPSYLTTSSKSGSLIRIDMIKSQPDTYAIYFHCQTKLIPTFRYLYPTTFKYEGNRAIVFHKNDVVPLKELKHCISLALTYYVRPSRRLK